MNQFLLKYDLNVSKCILSNSIPVVFYNWLVFNSNYFLSHSNKEVFLFKNIYGHCNIKTPSTVLLTNVIPASKLLLIWLPWIRG